MPKQEQIRKRKQHLSVQGVIFLSTAKVVGVSTLTYKAGISDKLFPVRRYTYLKLNSSDIK